MIALVVTIKIKLGHKEAFMSSILHNARCTDNDEPGCLRFDVLQDNEDPNKIHCYVVYTDQAAMDAHRQAPHYTKWRETVKDWFDGEITRRIATPVWFGESGKV
mgnify:CR=1 FL=1